MRNKGFFSVRTVIIMFVFFMLMNFLINVSPIGLAKLTEITGGHSILDMELTGYTVDQAYEIFDNLGDEGRSFNMRYIAPLDFPFPLSYALLYLVSLTLIVKSLWKNTKRPWVVGLIGIAAGIFDWLENIMIIILLRNYPKRLEGVARIANRFTQLKSFFVISSMALILIGLVVLIVRRFGAKSRDKLEIAD